MYVKTSITLTDRDGREDDYEVGATVTYESGGNGWAPSHEVGEPQFSAPGLTLKDAWLAADPSEAFPSGWSASVEEKLIETHEGIVSDLYDDRDPPSRDYPDDSNERWDADE